MKTKLIISDISAALLLVLFFYTALSKIFDHENFRTVLSTTPLITRFAAPLSWLLPAAELVIATLLLLTRTRRTGLLKE